MAPKRILEGYLLACMAAAGSLLLIFIFIGKSSSVLYLTLPYFLPVWVMVFGFTLLFTFVPVLIAVMISEWFALRSPWFHILVAVPVGVFAVVPFGDGTGVSIADFGFVMVPSVLGSLVYWSVSGRFAGNGPWLFILPLDKGILDPAKPNGQPH